jgi:hypothetical protein
VRGDKVVAVGVLAATPQCVMFGRPNGNGLSWVNCQRRANSRDALYTDLHPPSTSPILRHLPDGTGRTTFLVPKKWSALQRQTRPRGQSRAARQTLPTGHDLFAAAEVVFGDGAWSGGEAIAWPLIAAPMMALAPSSRLRALSPVRIVGAIVFMVDVGTAGELT